MIGNQRVLAVIPARGGSKRVPRKNLREFKGKTLLQWAIEHAKGSKYVDEIVVSSEDEEIGAAAGGLWIRRPECLATATATSESVMVDALYQRPGFDWAVLVQPTSPLRLPLDIDRCLEAAQAGDGSYSISESGRANGAVYVARVSAFLATLKIDNHLFYIMPQERSLDIDYEWDLK